MSTINVRIRHEDDADGVPLCTWEIADLDRLIPVLKRWGVYVAETEATEMSGQFTVTDSEAYFEVIVHTSEAAS